MTSPLQNTDLLLQQPENDHLEFKTDAGEPRRIARDLAAFANASGGLLIFGVDERDGARRIQGVDVQRTVARIERAVAMIEPQIAYKGHALSVGDLSLYAIEVPEQFAKPYVADGQLYVRRGERSVTATPDQIKSLVVQREGSPAQLLIQLDRFAEALAHQGKLIERLEQSSTWPRQLFWTSFGAVIGTVLGVVATILTK